MMDSFPETLNYLDFLENGLEYVEEDFEPRQRTPSPDLFEADDFIENQIYIGRGSPDIFEAHVLAPEDDRNQTTCLETRKAAMINKLKIMMSRERDEVRLFILDTILKLLATDSACTSRELFYKYPRNITIGSFYKKIHTIYTSLDVLPIDIGIYPSSKGLVAGNLKIILGTSDVIDCHLSEATNIPSQIDKIQVETSADTILLVEKETVFRKLIELKYFEKLPDIILLTGKGYPDLSIRLLLKKLLNYKDLKIYCLVDGDPHGIHIMTVYRLGSRALNHMKEKLACPEIRWIGVHPSEMRNLNLPMTPLTEADQSCLKTLAEKEAISTEIIKELRIMEELNAKTEIEYLSLPPFNYNLRDYVAEKINQNLCI